jgi:hypothetical protein
MKFWARKDEWFRYAACFRSRDHTVPPVRDDDGPVADALHVWEVCLGCRVRPECAAWAVDGSESGVWVCGVWIPGHDEDKRLAKEVRRQLYESIEEERRRRGDDV